MEVEEAVEVREVEEMELKYCERCGALWLRAKGSLQVYCAPCVPKMAEFAVARPRKGSPRMHVAKGMEMQAVVDEMAVLCLEGEPA